jgi:hypothetical protein
MVAWAAGFPPAVDEPPRVLQLCDALSEALRINTTLTALNVECKDPLQLLDLVD